MEKKAFVPLSELLPTIPLSLKQSQYAGLSSIQLQEN